MVELITTAKKGVEECYFKHHIKLITLIKQGKEGNIFLIDKSILFQLHQWKVVSRVVIKKGEECEIEFAEYSPFIYSALTRIYKFDKVIFYEKYKLEGDEPKPIKYCVEVIFDKLNLILELDTEKVCPVYNPPRPRRKKRRRKRNK